MSRRVALAIGVALVALVASLAAPLRQVSGDVIPTRYGGLLLACGGGFDLARVEWIGAQARPYWAIDTAEARVSVYGPAPAVVASLAFVGADTLDAEAIQRRGRLVAAVLVALAAAVLVLALPGRRSVLAQAALALVAVLSFAGAATLGQGLWQQSVTLPVLVAALAAFAGRARCPRLALATPALLVAAVLMRPTIAPLALGLGVAWCVAHRTRRAYLVASVGALAAAAPFVAWNLVVLGTPLPTAQLAANEAVSTSVFSPGGFGYGVAGLLVSPGRGLLWFAPLVIVVVVASVRTRDPIARAVAGGIVAQVIVMSCFHMWWGGICFGPRFLAETVWVSAWLAALVPVRRALLVPAAVITIVVGTAGLGLWRAEQWETRRLPDIDQNALWDLRDSPLTSLGRDVSAELAAREAPLEPGRVRCRGGRIEDQ